MRCVGAKLIIYHLTSSNIIRKNKLNYFVDLENNNADVLVISMYASSFKIRTCPSLGYE